MSENYRYIDQDFSYVDQNTGILKNLADINDANDLHFFESIVVSKRIQELFENPIMIESIQSLFKIHKHLFQDIYGWAGEKRKVEISKDGKQFFPTSLFDNAFNYIDLLIVDYKKTSKKNIKNLTEKLAEILDYINYLHPFREGNGRAQREFLRALALEKDLILNINPADDKNVYDRYMNGTINSDIKILTELILERISIKPLKNE